MARPEKVAVVEEVRDKLRDADAAVLTEYRGLTVSELAQLRGTLRPTSTEYKVFKNSLARRAAEAAGLDELLPLLEGPVAIAFVHGDAVIAAKALRDFGRTNPALVIKGGLLGPRVLTGTDVESLADIQPREVLLARLAGGFQAPLTKAAGLFQAFTRNLAYGLQAYIDQRVAAGEPAPIATPETTAPEGAPEPAASEPADTDTPATEPESAAASEPAAAVAPSSDDTPDTDPQAPATEPDAGTEES
ncbi:MAG TPA: 50S ribosomal protein L10 [Acidimicrobiia bacterium]|nr:50S ribosomal protein L10 [Acidimicrobiia bacterium]